ncbi:MAG: endonuclease NucS domain-containing protein [Candidatus Acidiferrales bacterium]
MSKEKEFESAIVKYPELIEEGLRLVGRQRFVEGRKFDLLFEDRKKNKLVAELKWGPIKDQHIGQIMFYAGCLISGQPVREVLVGTRVPPNIRAILDFHGIGWKQITATELREFLRAKGDEELAKKFDDEIENARVDAQPVDSLQPVIASGPAALFAPVEGKWLIKAREYFSTGKDFLYFFTRSR